MNLREKLNKPLVGAYNVNKGVFQMLSLNQIYQGDCLEVMKSIPTGSIDLCLTDPPYNISRVNNFQTMGRSGIDFGEWDKEADILSYIKEVARVLNKNGSFIVFNGWRNLGDIARFAESCGFETKDMLRLEKTNPMPRNRDRRYITDFECAIWFTIKGAKWVFNRMSQHINAPNSLRLLKKGYTPRRRICP